MKLAISFVIIGLSVISGAAYAVPEISPVFSRYAVEEGFVNLIVSPGSDTGFSKGFVTTLRYGDTEMTEKHDFEILPYLNYAQVIRLKDKIKGHSGEVVDYTVTITDPSGSSTVCEGKMRFIDPIEGNHGILVEEATGTWCGNCVRGIVGMASLEENYGDRFVGVAVHYNDPMQCGYYDHLSEAGYAHAFPITTVNRSASQLDPYYGTAAPGMWSNISAFSAALDEAPIATLDISAEFSDYIRKAWLTCKSQWAWVEPGHEYGYMFAVVENDVHSTGRGYSQQNTMAGHTNGGVWEWIENAGSPIPAENMWYQEVARSVEYFEGIPLADTPQTGKENVYQYELTFPANIINGKNQVLVVALIDKTTGEIASASKIPFADIVTDSRMPLFYCGGNWGYMTPGMSLYDIDGLEPFAGIPVGKGEGWSVVRLEEDEQADTDGYVMASTSYYRQPGRADDWMITPAIELPAQGHNTLTWRSRASLAEAPDGYEVYVSESGSSPSEILANGEKVFATPEEKNVWTLHEIDLDKYSGATIYVAFRNNSSNCELLYVDDITVDNDLRGSGIETVETDSSSADHLTLDYINGIVKAENADDSEIRIEIYSVHGILLASDSGNRKVSVDLRNLGNEAGTTGLVIVCAHTSTQTAYCKIAL